MNNEHYYHCATDGLKDDVLFPSTKAFIAGMNRIACCLNKSRDLFPVLIFAFCLMDNHVHFILYGTKENCNKFMDAYRISTEMWFSNHPEEGSSGKRWDKGIWLIPDKESLIEKIVYVLRNPMAAGLPYTPNGYRWSSGPLLFCDSSTLEENAVPLSNYSVRAQRKLLNSHEILPQDWLVLKDGMIWPGCYTENIRVEKLFRTAGGFIYESNKRVEGKVNAEMMEDFVSLPDKEIKEKALAITKAFFNKRQIADLSLKQRIKVASVLKKETGASTKQIARIVRVKLEDLKLLL